ncbi:MFS transporter [Streptomyces sp. NPDC057702]|uniref:MFS transporter n=1 Tax=unclassified Streptomyces TaxID=2593676 RepID=UPI0036907E29
MSERSTPDARRARHPANSPGPVGTAGAGPGGERRPRPALTLVAVLVALLVLPTSVTGSGVALPHIARDTNASLEALGWVVHGYNLTFASFMLACGCLADLVGRRRVFAAGGLLFALASAASAATSDIVVLDVLRGAAGVGAAALLTSGVSLLAATFTGPARGRVFAAVGIVTGAGLALGAMAAGVLSDALGWRSFFGLHAVLTLLALCAVPFLRESRGTAATRVDWVGTATLVTGLFLLLLGTVEGPHWGWGSGGVRGLLAGAALLLAVFVAWERRAPYPMLDLGLLRNARFLALCLIPVVVTFSFVVLLPLLPNYLLVAHRTSSRAAGATMLLMTLPILGTPLLAGGLLRWGLSTRHVFGLSLACLTVGVGWLAVVLQPGAGPVTLAGPLLTLGVGLGLNFGLVDGAVLDAVPPEATGAAAGFLNTLRLGSEALVIAAASSALVGLTRGRLADELGPSPASPGGSGRLTAAGLADSANAGDLTGPLSTLPADARAGLLDLVARGLTDAWQTVLWASAAICAALSVVVHVLLAGPGGGAPEPGAPGPGSPEAPATPAEACA